MDKLTPRQAELLARRCEGLAKAMRRFAEPGGDTHDRRALVRAMLAELQADFDIVIGIRSH